MPYAEGRYPGQPWKQGPLTGTITLKDILGNNLPDQILTERPANQKGGRRGSITIHKDSLARAVQITKDISGNNCETKEPCKSPEGHPQVTYC